MSDRKIRRVCSRNVPWIFQSSHIFAFPFLLGYLAAVPAVVIASRRNLACRDQVSAAAGDFSSGPLSDFDKILSCMALDEFRSPYWTTKRTSSGALAGGDLLQTMPMSSSQTRVGTRNAQEFPCDSVGADDLVVFDF